MVKVRLLPSSGLDLWQEFELPQVAASVVTDELWSAAREVEERYCLSLVTERPRISELLRKGKELVALTNALEAVAPHLTSGQAGGLMMETPVRVVGNLTLEAAERARVRLEAVGAVVEVRRGSQVIPGPSGRRYPVPHSGAVNSGDALPRPHEPDRADA